MPLISHPLTQKKMASIDCIFDTEEERELWRTHFYSSQILQGPPVLLGRQLPNIPV